MVLSSTWWCLHARKRKSNHKPTRHGSISKTKCWNKMKGNNELSRTWSPSTSPWLSWLPTLLTRLLLYLLLKLFSHMLLFPLLHPPTHMLVDYLTHILNHPSLSPQISNSLPASANPLSQQFLWTHHMACPNTSWQIYRPKPNPKIMPPTSQTLSLQPALPFLTHIYPLSTLFLPKHFHTTTHNNNPTYAPQNCN